MMKLHTNMMLNNITTPIRCREAHVGVSAVLFMATMSGENKCMRYKCACVYAAHVLAQHARSCNIFLTLTHHLQWCFLVSYPHHLQQKHLKI